jgi:hypothetical protein
MAKGECDGDDLCIPMCRKAPRITDETNNLLVHV